MALADLLSLDRLRGIASRGDAPIDGDAPRSRTRWLLAARPAKGSLTPASVVGFSVVTVPLVVALLARLWTGDLGRGTIVASPWSLLAPSWGAWTLAGLLIVAVYALVAWARLQLPAPDLTRTTLVALIGLLGFAVWCGAATFLWSDSPSGAWRWTVVALALVLASGLGLLAGAQREGRRALLLGVLASGTLVATIGLVELLVAPGLARRVTTPLDPTAAGVLTALGALVALGLDQQEHPQRRRWLRLAAGICVAATILTASRGASGILVLGLAVLSVRGVSVLWPTLQAAAGIAPGVVTALLGVGVARAGTGDATGRLIVAVLLVGGLALVAWGAARDVGVPAGLTAAIRGRRVQVGAAIALVVVVIGLLSLGTGGVARSWDRTSTAFSARAVPGVPADGSRLWSGTSDGRLWRWQAALDAYQQSGDPLRGLGPGTSAQLLRQYRRDGTPALTIPSAPIAILAESGLIGLALVLVGVLALSLAARAERRREDLGDSSLLLTLGTVVLAHALLNDDHLQPLLLVPAFAAVAAVAARPSLEQLLAPAPAFNTPPGRRTLVTAGGALIALVIALAALAPARAQLKARQAEASLARGGATNVQDAALAAGQATRIDPLSFQGDAIGSQAALAQQRWTEARRLALEAVRRAPREASAWRAVALVALAEHDRAGARIAARRLLQLDPATASTRAFALSATLDSAPPEASPTAIATPLTAAQN